PLPVERLEGCATRCHAFDDLDAVEHGPGDPSLLCKHQDVTRPSRFDRFVHLSTPHPLPARQLLFENSPATLGFEHCELPIEVLMGCGHTRITDEHSLPPFQHPKLGTEKRYTQAIDYTSTSSVYRILRQTVQLKACSRLLHDI